MINQRAWKNYLQHVSCYMFKLDLEGGIAMIQEFQEAMKGMGRQKVL